MFSLTSRMITMLGLCVLLSPASGAQDYIDTILSKNPFDPDRGAQPEVEEVEEEPQIVPRDLPVLDGTIIIGEYHAAIFSYREEGRPVSKAVTLNESIQGYTVVKVERTYVEIAAGATPIRVEMYDGNKDARGGSKSGLTRDKGMVAGTAKQLANQAVIGAEDNKKEDADNRSRFVRRQAPVKLEKPKNGRLSGKM